MWFIVSVFYLIGIFYEMKNSVWHEQFAEKRLVGLQYCSCATSSLANSLIGEGEFICDKKDGSWIGIFCCANHFILFDGRL